MYCPKCGKTNDDNAGFCHACGAAISSVNSDAAEQTLNQSVSKPKSSGLAIASLVLGIASVIVGWFMLFIPSILAVVFGHISRRQIKASNGAITGKGMALAGLITGYFSMTLGIVAILAAIAIPGYLGMQVRASNGIAQREIQEACSNAGTFFTSEPGSLITLDDLEQGGMVLSDEIEMIIHNGNMDSLNISARHNKGNIIYWADNDCNISEEKEQAQY